jgi:hypothetical protein
MSFSKIYLVQKAFDLVFEMSLQNKNNRKREKSSLPPLGPNLAGPLLSTRAPPPFLPGPRPIPARGS